MGFFAAGVKAAGTPFSIRLFVNGSGPVAFVYVYSMGISAFHGASRQTPLVVSSAYFHFQNVSHILDSNLRISIHHRRYCA